MKPSGLLTGYLIWTVAVALWMSTALGLGWKMPAMDGGTSFGTGSTRSGGGYFPHSSWSFGK
jgi:hypothetical protein